MIEAITVKLLDGRFAEHGNIYKLGWPPPERIVALSVRGKVAVTTVEYLDQAREIDPDAVVYRKNTQSILPEIPEDVPLARGASYLVDSEVPVN